MLSLEVDKNCISSLLPDNMADKLNANEVAAIRHWSLFGQKGTSPAQRVTSSDKTTKPFEKPATAAWDQPIPHSELPRLTLGFLPGAMEDKWFVYADGPDPQGNGILHMHRSWTGYKEIEATFRFELDEDGKSAEKDARFTTISWETSKKVVLEEEEAKNTAKEVCNWCMGIKLP